MPFSTIFSYKPANINPDSFFWQKIVNICHIACPNWIKNVDFRRILCFWVKIHWFWVKICRSFFFSKFGLEMVEISGQTFLKLVFGRFLGGSESTFSDISGIRLKSRKRYYKFFGKLISSNLGLWKLFSDFPLPRNSAISMMLSGKDYR